ncbi:hypothetical protein BH10CYA1_BH10CYA1_55750 [soil metagenome]
MMPENNLQNFFITSLRELLQNLRFQVSMSLYRKFVVCILFVVETILTVLVLCCFQPFM